LRTPLNAILGFAQLMEFDALTPDQAESVAHILSGGRHLLGLINEVLDIARIESGRLPLSLEAVEVREAMQEAAELMQPLARARNIRLTTVYPSDPHCAVMVDRQRVKQILLNLLANAIKYNREHGTVTFTSEVVEDRLVRIDVRDTGPGISPVRLERLFTPFDRLGAEASGVEGTGLGLALSLRLAEVMGGRLAVQSAVGEGSTFSVEFPRVESVVAVADSSGVGREAAPVSGAAARTVLYIEDNLSNLTLVRRLFAQRSEVTLLPAMQGQLGLDLAREHHPDLILLDLHLPDLPGSLVLERLQEDARTQGIPVAVITADATVGQRARLLAAGARAYLTKPLDVHEFLAVVDALLDAAPAGSTP
jgi:CheY-like chemotaxis protein